MATLETATGDTLTEEVRVLLRAGLPVRPGRCGPELLALRGMQARSLRPEDPASRARALDGLLRGQLDRLENVELAASARLLFGVEPSTSGATLTLRRGGGPQAGGHQGPHFPEREA